MSAAIVWLVYAWVNIGLALIQHDIVMHRIRTQNPNQINHFWWTAIYITLMVPLYFLKAKWTLIGAIALQHLFIFGMTYAVMMGNNAFYLSKTSKAWSEKTLLKWGLKSAEIPYGIAFALSLALLIKTIV